VPKDTHRTATTDQVLGQLPERVTVAVAEVAGAAREGLLALAVGTGLQVLQALLTEDVAGWNRSAPLLRPPLRGPSGRRSRAGSSPGPNLPWPSCSPRT
jgi:hypothetical protein